MPNKRRQPMPKIEKAAGIGFCFGVKRTIDLLEKMARDRGELTTLGAPIHNERVLERLAKAGVKVADSLEDIEGGLVAIGAHGVSPQLEEQIRARSTEVINTTCPFVHRAQLAAQRLAKAGFFVVVYGEANHPEVKGILGWADNQGIATLDARVIEALDNRPKRLGILSQTTQITSSFAEFAKDIIDFALTKDAEIRIIDTICHDIRSRQQSAFKLAQKVDLMLVVGSHTSANSHHLADLCAKATETYLIETADEIRPEWLGNYRHIGVAAGSSTAEETVREVLDRLQAKAQQTA